MDAVSAATNTGLLLASRSIPKHLGKPWDRPLADNSVKPIHVGMPLLIVQGGDDGVVIPKVTRRFAALSCNAGDIVRYLDVPDATHTTIGERAKDITLQWTADRFAHRPPPSDCVSLTNPAR